MSQIRILHNPRCSKSRQTLQLLQDRGLNVEVVEYLKAPLSATELAELQQKLAITDIREMMRTKEDIYKELQLGAETVSEDDLRAAIVAHPILLERPVVVTDTGARIGRPPESVLELL
ncbi:arsenate reductase (glutaredoxin) [Bowmanella yangjiangensis]|uniref:Arsenate reductase n=1 Tax=Bowmanella yangjiangensis TaxID=2811230 RepID=A0ABS3CVG3_9ALTE|nr:arsenate reductase (glutaredoxin) [Bowmanella yangjiangensis]MBN7821102.1 arsenate reductase (glutaredoxin) [Bowmanella yangjiangensis]